MFRRHVVFVLLLSLMIPACGETPTRPSGPFQPTASFVETVAGNPVVGAPQPDSSAVRVAVSEDGSQVVALFPDGTRVSGPEAVAARIQMLVVAGEEVQLDIGIATPGQLTAQWDFERVIYGTPYSVRISGETGWMAGCINRTAPHIGLRIRDTRIPNFSAREVFNAHLVGWRESGRWCAGLYVTAKMWTRAPLVCQKLCSPSRPSSSTQQMLVNAMLAAGITYAAAVAISWIVAPLIIFV